MLVFITHIWVDFGMSYTRKPHHLSELPTASLIVIIIVMAVYLV